MKKLWKESAYAICKFWKSVAPSKSLHIPFHEWDGYTSVRLDAAMMQPISLTCHTWSPLPTTRLGDANFRGLRHSLFWSLCGSEFWKKHERSDLTKINSCMAFLFGSNCHHSLFMAMAPNNAASSWICAAVASSLVCTDKSDVERSFRGGSLITCLLHIYYIHHKTVHPRKLT